MELDWAILETLDDVFIVGIELPGGWIDVYIVPGVVSGDSGRARFPITVRGEGSASIILRMQSGGGKIAIDNIRVSEGGAGPWRRDFEGGFVLVNPLNRPHTFSPEELAGEFARTGIRRILGTQAPEVNNGEAVTDSFTLAPFDAIVLLADAVSR